jgi:PTS system mannose-specific IID component
MTSDPLPKKILLQTFFRSFLLQASWSFQGLQSLGLLFVLLPALQRLNPGDELQNACARYLEQFNTHPYMASPIIGMCLALEERPDKECGVSSQELKEMTMFPYAAIGDSLFWGGLKPLAAVISLFLAVKGWLWAPVVFLVLFNIPHLVCRLGWFWQGYRNGLEMLQNVQKWQLPDLAIRLKEATIVLLGSLSAFLVMNFLMMEGMNPGLGILFIPLLGAAVLLFKKGVSSLTCILASGGVVYLVSFIWNWV